MRVGRGNHQCYKNYFNFNPLDDNFFNFPKLVPPAVAGVLVSHSFKSGSVAVRMKRLLTFRLNVKDRLKFI